MVSVVDTNKSTLLVYAGLQKDMLNQVQTDAMVRPCNVMVESAERSWLVLDTTIAAAADRALRWGFEELGKEQDELQLVLIAFEFTALGVGHFMLTNQLGSTRGDWHHFRFYGNLPLRCTNIEDQLLVTGWVSENPWHSIVSVPPSPLPPVA